MAGALTLRAAGETTLAFAVCLVSSGLALDGAFAFRRARRSAVGAKSEAQVRRALRPLRRAGWHIAHASNRRGRGDLDHIARTPSGISFVIETKTL